MSSSGADQNKAERQEADGTREELRAIFSARQELGTEYNDELADMLMERLDAVIDRRVEARLQTTSKSSLPSGADMLVCFRSSLDPDRGRNGWTNRRCYRLGRVGCYQYPLFRQEDQRNLLAVTVVPGSYVPHLVLRDIAREAQAFGDGNFSTAITMGFASHLVLSLL